MPRLNMNLKLFSEEAPQVEAPTEQVESQQSTEAAETQESTETEVSEVQEEQATPSLLDSFEYQYNKENVKPQSMEELKELAEMGRYYKEQGKNKLESYKNDPRIGLVERLANENNMSVDQYLEAVDKQREYDKIQAIANEKNVPVEVASELYEAMKLKDEFKNEQQTKAQKEAEDKAFGKFLSEYKGDVNNLPPDLIELWGETGDINQAHTAWKFKQMESKIAEYEDKLNTQNQNIENSQASTGSVTGNGSPNEKLYTRAEVKKMSRQEINANFDKVIKSQKSWN